MKQNPLHICTLASFAPAHHTAVSVDLGDGGATGPMMVGEKDASDETGATVASVACRLRANPTNDPSSYSAKRPPAS